MTDKPEMTTIEVETVWHDTVSEIAAYADVTVSQLLYVAVAKYLSDILGFSLGSAPLIDEGDSDA